MVEIRVLTNKDDLLIVSGIYEKSWKSAYRGIIPDTYLDSIPKGKWADGLQNPKITSLLMRESGNAIGTASFSPARMENMRGFGELVSIYLLPEFMGKGYGKQLLTAAIEQLVKAGYQNIYLWVLEENKNARRFYEKFGFQESGAVLQNEIGGKALREVQYVYTVVPNRSLH